MKRLIIIAILLAMVWLLSYALAFVLRTPGDRGFRYPPDGLLDRLLYPVFEPLYRLHGVIDAKRPRHERDPSRLPLRIPNARPDSHAKADP